MFLEPYSNERVILYFPVLLFLLYFDQNKSSLGDHMLISKTFKHFFLQTFEQCLFIYLFLLVLFNLVNQN